MLAALLALLIGASHADAPGDFDYYLLSLSWSPQYCDESSRGHESQCDGTRPYAFVVHGLWPQHERGYPKNCGRGAYLPQTLINRLLPLMPDKRLIIHEWQQHGTCSGLDAEAYFGQVERVWRTLRVPPRYQQVPDYLSTDVVSLKASFIEANPSLTAAGMITQCRGAYLQELRICLDRNLRPRACGTDLHDRCDKPVVLRPTR